MKRSMPLVVTIIGLLLLAAPMLYDMTAFHIPLQDAELAPPHVVEEYNRQYNTSMAAARRLHTTGLFITGIGGFLLFAQGLGWRRLRDE